jgi:hypothetical protein
VSTVSRNGSRVTQPLRSDDERHIRSRKLLKRDLFGTVTLFESLEGTGPERWIGRDIGTARWWLRPVAARLAAREARALERLVQLEQVPRLHRFDGCRLDRSYLEGLPMQVAEPRDPAYFRAALRLVRRMHRAGVAHNDLAKEPNWLVDPRGAPAIVDFQLASLHRSRGRWFRMLAHDDLRHLLKHKRTYCPERLTRRELAILARPSLLSRLWMRTGKPIYRFVTRGLLGWADREGAGDR